MLFFASSPESLGYVVFAVNHTYASHVSEFPDGRIVISQIHTHGKSYQDPQKIANVALAQIWMVHYLQTKSIRFSKNHSCSCLKRVNQDIHDPYDSKEDMLKVYKSREEEKESMQKYFPAMDDLISKVNGLGEKIVVSGTNHDSLGDGPLLSQVSWLFSILSKENMGTHEPLSLHDEICTTFIKFFQKNL